MSSLIETLNQWGGIFLNFAWPLLWQSSLLIAALFAFDFLFRRRVRASIRYALWLVVLVKLCLPPMLASPTSPVWWLHKTPSPVVTRPETHYTVTHDNGSLPEISHEPLPVPVPLRPPMLPAAWLLVASCAISLALLVWLLVRWYQITRQVRRAKTSDRLAALAGEAQGRVGTNFNLTVKLTTNSMSPAVCGLFRPAVLIPQSLADDFSDEQLRAVLLHELIHLSRRDVWVNFFQALLQIAYWWHPLVWLANARIRRVREEAVDDAVMLVLRDEADVYAPTLLAVAKLALNRPLASLGLVGILESRQALRQRIERLIDFQPPRQAGLTMVSLLGILAFTAIAVPMGDGPSQAEQPALPVKNTNAALMTATGIAPDPNFQNAIRALKQRTGSETLPEPEVTTTSGHDANQIGTDNFYAQLGHPAHKSSNQMAITFKLQSALSQNDLNSKLVALGVKPPTTTIFFTNNGLLLVRGSKEQLELVTEMVIKLNGDRTKKAGTNYDQFIKEIGEITSDERPFVTETNLISRHFRVDVRAITTGLRYISDLQTGSLTTMAKSFFGKLGVDWDVPGKSIFFNDGMDELFVMATTTDLDTIENALEVLSRVLPQIHIKARFIEVPKGTLQGLKNVISLTNQVAGLVGILTDENFRTVMRNLETQPGGETLAEPEVTTTSGRQTQMRATVIQTIITNFVFQETSTNASIVPQASQIETGPILDVVPSVLSDGYTINLKVKPSLTEFLGYATPTNTKTAYNRAGEKIDVPKVLPRFTVREVTANLNLRDNQTAVLKGIEDHSVTGGLPPGGLMVGAKPEGNDQDLLVFITATIVDPAGNRVHPDN